MFRMQFTHLDLTWFQAALFIVWWVFQMYHMYILRMQLLQNKLEI